MRSQTSYFNGSVLRKDLARFAPLWALYTIFWLLFAVLFFDAQTEAVHMARNWGRTTRQLTVFNLIYAAISAYLLFGDLFNSRMCNALHATPMRREGWLLTHSVTALLFALIPYLLTAVLVTVYIPQYMWIVAVWFAVAMLEFIFFYGLALFSVMCAGNIMGMGAVYFILNFFFVLLFGLFFLLYVPLLHGITVESFNIVPFVPLMNLSDNYFLNDSLFHKGIWSWNGEFWLYLAVCVTLGIIAWFLALILYRRRKLECAGDFVAFRPVAPVFLIFYTLGAGCLLHLLTTSMGTAGYAFLAIGIILGFFTGKMLLHKTVRIFRPRTFAQLALLLAVLAGTMVLTWKDPTGITYYVPEADDIVGVRIYSEDNAYVYRNNIVAQSAMATDPAEVENLRQMHQQMTRERNYDEDAYNTDVQVVYLLKNGASLKRTYRVDTDSPLGQELKLHFSDFRQVFFTNNWNAYAGSVKTISCQNNGNKLQLPWDEYGSYEFTQQEVSGLLAALKADCDAGNMVQDWSYYRNSYLESQEQEVCWLYVENDMAAETRGTDIKAQGTRSVDLHISTKCVHTVAYLQSLSK